MTLHDIVHTDKSLTLVFEFLERDLKQYMDDCGGILAMNNVKVGRGCTKPFYASVNLGSNGVFPSLAALLVPADPRPRLLPFQKDTSPRSQTTESAHQRGRRTQGAVFLLYHEIII